MSLSLKIYIPEYRNDRVVMIDTGLEFTTTEARKVMDILNFQVEDDAGKFCCIDHEELSKAVESVKEFNFNSGYYYIVFQ